MYHPHISNQSEVNKFCVDSPEIPEKKISEEISQIFLSTINSSI